MDEIASARRADVKTLPRAICALVLSALLACSAAAQDPSAPGTSIALVDMNFVFKNHLRFKAAMEDLKTDIKNYEAALADRQKQASLLNERLGQFKSGTPEYKQFEGQLARLTSETQVDVTLKRKEFLEREAKVYYQAYMDVIEQVTDYSLRNSIALVLSYNGEPINPQDRTSVLQGVNRAVVYQETLDITPYILERLNRGAPTQNLGARPALPQRR
jgi:Skp family chaperone for outer membrane proteins